MSRFHWLILAVLVFPWLGSEAAAPVAASQDMSGGWRRTRDGWEHHELFAPTIQYRRPALHPLVVSSLEILLTMTAMLALSGEASPGRSKRHPRA